MKYYSNKNDNYGKIGMIDVNEVTVDTPEFFPNGSDIFSFKKSPLIRRKHMRRFKHMVHVEWFNSQRIDDLKKEGYEKIKKKIDSKLKEYPIDVALVHFEFDSDVKDLPLQVQDLFLDLQNDLELDTVVIPNAYRFNKELTLKRIKVANNWREHTNKDIKLMAVIPHDNERIIKSVAKLDEDVDCYGVSLHHMRSSKPMFNYVKEYLKSKNKWIHAFSTPRAYKDLQWKGSIGPLHNYYGIDTYNFYSQIPHLARSYVGWKEKLSDDEKGKMAEKERFFNPENYGQVLLEEIKAVWGSDFDMGGLCPCPVCQNVSDIENLIKPFNDTYPSVRSHESFANSNEAISFRLNEKADERKNYILGKTHANRIIKIKQRVLKFG
jgi:hypothetical protein